MSLTPIYYEGSKGDIVQLNDGTCFVNANDLRNFKWNYDIVGRPSGLGGRVRKISRQSVEKKMTIAIRGAIFLARINMLHAVSEYDVLTNQPGKLWVNGAYMPCYLGMASDVVKHSKRVGFAEKEIAVLSVDPFWHTEVTQSFSPSTGTIAGGKRYNLRFPYRYGTGYSNQVLYNSHFADTPARIVFYGPVELPSITIAGHVYAVNTTLLANERVEVDQLKHTIIKIGASGDRVNMFNARNKESDIFQPIPAGNSSVQFESMSFAVTLVQQRSEPLWT